MLTEPQSTHGADSNHGPSQTEHTQVNHPETLKEASGTNQCTKPYIEDKPLVQYALMIDAGSTGSRIHVYKFNNCHSQPAYENEVFKQTRPGLSSYANSPSSAAESLDVLMNEAMNAVPSQLHRCTPVAVKATAGLRLLGTDQSAAILKAVEERLAKQYPFPLSKKDPVVILDGKDEGVFAWITINYLLRAFDDTGAGHPSTFAVLDLGGASTQIVFEPRAAGPDSQLLEGEHRYALHFAGNDHTLYQHSYLGYGLMEARKSVHRLVHFMTSFNKDPSRIMQAEVANPCLSKGTWRKVDVNNETYNMTGGDVGSFNGCKRVVELVMAKDA